MTIGPYIDFTLGGAGSAANISEGVQSGDIRQVTGGAYQGLGAYIAASNAVKGGLPSASAVGSWLPWIGAGLAVYDWTTGEITGESTINMASAVAGFFVHPAFFVPAAMNMSVAMFKSHNRGQEDILVDVYTPELELKYTDENNNYYLEASPGVWLRYNPESNVLETYGRDSKGGTDYANLDELQNAEWREFTGQIPAGDSGYEPESWYVAGRIWDMPSLQTQIYNKVLLPEGLAPMPSTEPINVNGKEYYRDESGLVYRSNGQIAGHYDEESNTVLSFELKNDPDRDFAQPRLNINDPNSTPPEYKVFGQVYDSPAYAPSDDIYVTKGIGFELDPYSSSIDLTWMEGELGNEGDSASGFHLYDENAASQYFSNNPGFERYNNSVIAGEGPRYNIDTQTGNLYYGETIIGHTDIKDENYSGTCQGFPTYNTDGRVRDSEGNFVGYITVDLGTGRVSMNMSPSNLDEALEIYQNSDGYGYEGEDQETYKSSLEYNYASIPDYPADIMDGLSGESAIDTPLPSSNIVDTQPTGLPGLQTSVTSQSQGLPGLTPSTGLPQMQETQPYQERLQSSSQGLPGLTPAPMTTVQPDQMQGNQTQIPQQGLPGFQNPFNIQNIPMPSPGLPGLTFPSVGLAARI